MNYKALVADIKKKKSFLCIGLDTDLEKIPSFLLESDDPAFEFNRKIVDATHDLVIAYKPNLAFYESMGIEGWMSITKTVAYIRQHYPEIFLIADAKRGDIGNTSKMYAKAFLDKLGFDAITVAPYMGEDSVSPFLSYKDKWVILLALTSNKGAFDFQYTTGQEGERLFEKVLKKSQDWGTKENMMFVVGATKAEELQQVRKLVPEHFLLIPGVGAQGGSLEKVVQYGMNSNCGLIVNSSREIIYAASSGHFETSAREKAHALQKEMAHLLKDHHIIK